MSLTLIDPRYVKVLLDIAHYQQGGGDPVRAVRKFSDRILFLHIKDVQSPLPGNTGDPMRSYRFVELGRGKVDIASVFTALNEVKFRGETASGSQRVRPLTCFVTAKWCGGDRPPFSTSLFISDRDEKC